MPYIKQEERVKFDDTINNLHLPDNAGELNYLIATILVKYIKKHGLKYQFFNDVIGVLE